MTEPCTTQKRGSRAVCTGMTKGHALEHNFVLPPETEEKPKTINRDSREFRVARMLAAILNEPQDNVDEPGEVRMEQARELLTHWSSSQYAVTGMLLEILNLKAGFCVRCPEDPCPVCGSTSTSIQV